MTPHCLFLLILEYMVICVMIFNRTALEEVLSEYTKGCFYIGKGSILALRKHVYVGQYVI